VPINPTLPPTVAEFRAAFPEFADVADPTIQLYLDIGMLWVDTFWFNPDAKIAAMYAAAHFLALHDRASGGQISGGGGSGGGGGVVDPDIGLIWAKSIRFRDRQVTYERVSAAAEKVSSGSTVTGSSEFWESTPYGQLYLSFRRRNAPHVAVV
jgi:hypothetical protein